MAIGGARADAVRMTATGVAIVLYAWWATGLETFTAGSTWAIVGGGGVTMAWGTWHRRRAPRQRRHDGSHRASRSRPGLAAWLILLAALTVWQLQAFVQSPRSDHPTISSLVNTALSTDVARTVACAIWIGGAYRLARRDPAAEPAPLSAPGTPNG